MGVQGGFAPLILYQLDSRGFKGVAVKLYRGLKGGVTPLPPFFSFSFYIFFFFSFLRKNLEKLRKNLEIFDPLIFQGKM